MRFRIAIAALAALFTSGCVVTSDDIDNAAQDAINEQWAEVEASRSASASPTPTEAPAPESQVLGLTLPEGLTLTDTEGGGEGRDWYSEEWSYYQSVDESKDPGHQEYIREQVATDFPANGWTRCETLADSYEQVGGNFEAWSNGTATVHIGFLEYGSNSGQMKALWVKRGRCVTGYPADRN
ncbi:MAG: hypothetical protein WBB00_07920 [Mycobacterium sp.]